MASAAVTSGFSISSCVTIIIVDLDLHDNSVTNQSAIGSVQYGVGQPVPRSTKCTLSFIDVNSLLRFYLCQFLGRIACTLVPAATAVSRRRQPLSFRNQPLS